MKPRNSRRFMAPQGLPAHRSGQRVYLERAFILGLGSSTDLTIPKADFRFIRQADMEPG
jgi:hypothetical protein